MSDFEIRVDGRAVPVRDGQTIGAALVADGVRWPGSHGVFCGIGVCFNCLVTVNDEAGLRACQVAARPGDRVNTT